MLHTSALLSLLCSTALAGAPVPEASAEPDRAAAESSRPAADPPIVLDARRQLFLDDHLVASRTSGVRRTVVPARKSPANPVIWPTEPWEPPMATAYGSVIRDEGRYRMWYKSGMGVAYAESDDGLSWRKPRLDLTLVDGEPTNILFRKGGKTEPPEGFPHYYELFGVHRDDRDPDPSRRYKMGYLCIDWKHEGPGGDPWHAGQRRGLGVGASPDGIRWRSIATFATEAIVDGATHWLWDAATSRYVLYGRTRRALPEVVAAWSSYEWFATCFSGRAVARIASPDFLSWDFGKPDTAPVVLTADLEDRPGTEIYSMKVFPYEGAWIGLVQVFHATPGDSTLDVQLAASRDGKRFTRVGDRATFIELGGIGTWDRFNLSLSNNDPIAVGDELRIYYGGRSYRHGPYSGKDKGPERSGIGVATVPRDRFVALEASFDGGEVVTRPLRLPSAALHLNAAAAFGEISVEVLDPEGKVLARSRTIRRDALDIPVAWKEPFEAPETPVALRIGLSNARLFAIWCDGVSAAGR